MVSWHAAPEDLMQLSLSRMKQVWVRLARSVGVGEDDGVERGEGEGFRLGLGEVGGGGVARGVGVGEGDGVGRGEGEALAPPQLLRTVVVERTHREGHRQPS